MRPLAISIARFAPAQSPSARFSPVRRCCSLPPRRRQSSGATRTGGCSAIGTKASWPTNQHGRDRSPWVRPLRAEGRFDVAARHGQRHCSCGRHIWPGPFTRRRSGRWRFGLTVRRSRAIRPASAVSLPAPAALPFRFNSESLFANGSVRGSRGHRDNDALMSAEPRLQAKVHP